MMNKAFVLVALSSASMLSADYYNSGSYNPSCPGGNCQYNPNQGRSYQGSSYQDNSHYYQDGRSGQPYNRSDRSSGQYQDRSYQDNRGGSAQSQDRSYQDNRSSSGQSQDRSNQDNRDGYYNPSNTNSGSRTSSPTSYNDNKGTSRYADDRSDTRAKNISDQDVAKEVHDILEADWLSSGYPDVTFDVNNGVVNLRGRVTSLDDKTKLENSVRKVDGVKQVKSDVTVIQDKTTGSRMKNSHMADNDKSYHDKDKGYHDSKVEKTEKDYPRDTAASDSDRHVNSKIRHKLSGWFSKGYETIILNTENGVVTITGFVETPDDAQKITKETKNVEGVKTVNNKVSVQPKK